MKNLTCIVCPIGCSLDVDESNETCVNVTGNRCARGITYAQEEIRAPKRIVTATAAVIDTQPEGVSHSTDAAQTEFYGSIRRIPVKTSSPCLREKIPALLQDIYKVKITLPVKSGDIVIANWRGEKIDVIATRTVDN